MKRTKAKRIEAWAVWDNPPAPGDSGREGFQSELHASKGDAYEVANRYDAGACRVVHLVEADPLARLKEDVVRAAVERLRAEREMMVAPFARERTDACSRAGLKLVAAVERLERKRR